MKHKKNPLSHLGIGKDIEPKDLDDFENILVKSRKIKSSNSVRKNWGEAFQKMHRLKEDDLLIPDDFYLSQKRILDDEEFESITEKKIEENQ